MALIRCAACKKTVTDEGLICPNCGRPLSQALKGSDWQRHEENVAKVRSDLDLLDLDLWDFGVGQAFKATLAPTETAVAQAIQQIPDGLTLVNWNGAHVVYIEKDSKHKKADIGLRVDFVARWGEETVAKIDATILGKK
jgi:hypothetical protein